MKKCVLPARERRYTLGCIGKRRSILEAAMFFR